VELAFHAVWCDADGVVYDRPGAPGRGHWVFEDPFSKPLRTALLEAARERGHAVRDGGCYGHVDGPRFNTKSEIRSLRAVGVSAVSQTAGPEMTLCGEAGLPYGLLGYVTDYANGVADEATPVETLMRLLRESGATLADTLEPDPCDVAAGHEQATQLRSALAQLPDEQRRALELAYLQGRTHTEIATLMDCPLGTVKGRIRIGLARLRTLAPTMGLSPA